MNGFVYNPSSYLFEKRLPFDPLQELQKEWGFGSATAEDERFYLRFEDTILEGSHPIVSHPPSLSPPKKEAYHD
jgi:hypothetical protein